MVDRPHAPGSRTPPGQNASHDVSARLAAALVDRYRIDRKIGEGGMATVFLANDLKHERSVAIKVLKPELGALVGADRFLSEIKVTAHLQHPNVLPLFDSGDANGLLYYVMPFVEGESLRARLVRERQFPVDEAVHIAVAIAGALEYAHHAGVIHRDLKPENILLQAGQPMIADFGIALAVSNASGERVTQTGMSLGTPQYMSPEQARGDRVIDGRTDIYSLAAITYEMLIGEPPHASSSAQAILTKLLTEDVPTLSALRRTVPGYVDLAVRHGLERVAADRFSTARSFAEALGNPAYTLPAGHAARPDTAATRRWARRFYASVAAGVALLAFALFGLFSGAQEQPPSRQRVVLWRTEFRLPTNSNTNLWANQAAIAPDASSIVFSDSIGDGFQRLLRKARSQSTSEPMAGTEGAVSPFFSPDGVWVGYLTRDGKLRKVPTIGGGSVTIAEDANIVQASAAWLDDRIVYVDRAGGFRFVSADGGESSEFEKSVFPFVAGSLWPLPDGRGFLYTVCPGNCSIQSQVRVYDLRADSSRRLVDDAAGAWYSPTGHLLYTDRAGGLHAASFDLRSLSITSGAVMVIEGVVPTQFTLSHSGTVLYSVGPAGVPPADLVWVTRGGVVQPMDTTWRAVFNYPALSPDGKTLAVNVTERSTTELWLWRADRDREKLHAEGSLNWRPSWTADGRSLGYLSGGGSSTTWGRGSVYRSLLDGSHPELVQSHTFGLWEVEYSRDGRWVVVRTDQEGDNSDILARRLDGDSTLIPVLVANTDETQAALSPDGRWLAYTSDASGSFEVYVASFPDASIKRMISRGGGAEPRWARSGRELFFKSGGKLMAVDVSSGPTFSSGVPRPLFPVDMYRAAFNRQQYDVAPDDRRFVMIRELGAGAQREQVYVEHWFTELRAKLKR